METLTVQENWPKVGVVSILWTDGWSRFYLTTYHLFIWRKTYWFLSLVLCMVATWVHFLALVSFRNNCSFNIWNINLHISTQLRREHFWLMSWINWRMKGLRGRIRLVPYPKVNLSLPEDQLLCQKSACLWKQILSAVQLRNQVRWSLFCHFYIIVKLWTSHRLELCKCEQVEYLARSKACKSQALSSFYVNMYLKIPKEKFHVWSYWSTQ